MKYILLKVSIGVNSGIVPVLFKDNLIHSDMFHATRKHICDADKIAPCYVTLYGAGQCHIQKGMIQVHGGSSSLGMMSKPSDALDIERYL